MKKLIYLLILLPFAGCYNDKEALLYPAPTCDVSAVHFSTTIKTILDANCATAGCHNANTSAGGYNFSGYPDAQRAAQDGSLVGSITHAQGYSPMPRNAPPLSDCNIDQIKAWVASGAPNN